MSRRFMVAFSVTLGPWLSIAVMAQSYSSADVSNSRPSDRDVLPSHFPQGELVQSVQPSCGTPPQAWGQEVRTIDGTCNNIDNPLWGCAFENLMRVMTPDYGDGVSTMAGGSRPSPRMISNMVCDQPGPTFNAFHASDYLWQWGQFLDHDLDLTPAPAGVEPMPIPVPMGDEQFDPKSTGTKTISFDRSAFDAATGTNSGNPRQQFNIITAYIDASNVYGSDDTRATWLRMLDGSGRLKTSAGDLLPYNTAGLPNAGGTSPSLFIAGDVRANEQVALTAMHTLFVREHNRLVDQFQAAEPSLSDEELYQRARAHVGAMMQVITYKEFLPILLGPDAIPSYEGYDPAMNGGISNIFSTACFRLGHSLLSPQLLRLNAGRQPIPEGHLPLRDAFFAPTRLVTEGGIEPILRGLAFQVTQDVDPLVVDDVRNFLFGMPGEGGLDLPSLNIQRGRDHGLPSYNEFRKIFSLAPVASFSEITSHAARASALQSAYGDVDDVDVWVGALSEDHLPGAMVGELLHAVLVDQFTRLRDGDRFWYQNFFSGGELAALEQTRLSDIIRRNTDIGLEIQDDVFIVSAGGPIPAASAWGLAALALLLATVGTITAMKRSART